MNTLQTLVPELSVVQFRKLANLCINEGVRTNLNNANFIFEHTIAGIPLVYQGNRQFVHLIGADWRITLQVSNGECILKGREAFLEDICIIKLAL